MPVVILNMIQDPCLPQTKWILNQVQNDECE